jgi:thiol-disulfide isomerase/thioredoxin
MAKIEEIASREEFHKKVAVSREGAKSGHQDGDLFCVKYYAAWCKSCKAIAPKYAALAEKYDEHVSFYEMKFVNTAERKEIFKELGVTKTPCVQFYRGADRLATVTCSTRHWTDVEKHLEMYLDESLEDECEINKEFTECIAKMHLQPVRC